MFKRENRLVPEIKFSNSFIFNTPQFVLKEKKNGLTINRFGIVVSKKIDKRAVGRNEIKRFFRATLLGLRQKMNVGHDILVIVKKGITVKTREENIFAIESGLTKAGILK